MLPRPSKGRIGRDASVVEFALTTTLVLFLIGAPGTRAQSASTDTSSGRDSTTMSPIQATSVQQVDGIDYAELLREVVDYGFAKLPPSLLRNFIQAGLQPQCSIALIRTLKGMLDFEPWALRLFDASGKFPTGLFQGSHIDAGAFDECLETVVHHGHRDGVSRGRYCNLLIYAQNGTAMRDTVELLSKYLHPKLRYFKDYYSIEDVPFVRLGICFTDECNRNDLQALVNIVKPPLVRLEVSNCVTAEPEPWDKIQTAIVLFLGVLLVIVLISTLVDELWNAKPKQEKENGTLLEFVSAFSVTANTRQLLKGAENIHGDGYDLQFMHGMRFFCCIHIVLGLFFTNLSDIWARVLNLFITSDHWPHMIATAMFNSVDTFFFISGFFLCLTVSKQKTNGPLVFLTNVIRRLIRLLLPLTFVVMCLYPLPHFVAGPDVKAFFVKLNDEIDNHWWKLLLHIRNFYGSAVVGARGNERSCGPVADVDCEANPARNSIVTPPPPPSPLVHVWYLSADFQLFLISLLVASIFKSWRPLAVRTFILLSGICCAIGTWVVASSEVLPFLVFPGPLVNVVTNTFDEYYVRPYYHAVCYFSGCITFLIMAGFKKKKITKGMQVAGWCLSVSCGLASVFAKLPWYRSANPTTQGVTLIAAFFDRIFWSVFLIWITLACSLGRGGLVSRFLSWNGFVPLSKLTFGVYLIHLPFVQLMLHASRERIFWSHFNVITLWFATLVWCFLLAYVVFLACEAPSTTLCRLIFGGPIGQPQTKKDAIEEKIRESHITSCL